MATWQDYIDLFPEALRPVIETLETTYESEFSISDYETYAAQSSDTIRTQLVSLGETKPLLLAYATYYLEIAADVSPDGDGALSAYQLMMLKMAEEEMQCLGKLQSYFEGIDTSFETFQAMSVETLAAAFGPANTASGFWAVTAFALSSRIAVLADAEFGGFVLSLPLEDRTSVESFFKLMVANDAEFDLDALRGMSSKALAGKFKTLTTNPLLRYHWAHKVISTVRGLLDDHTPDDMLEGQFLSSQGKYMRAGLEALQKSLAVAELATDVRAIGGLWLDAIVGQMATWSSGHLFFHGAASDLLANLQDYDRTLAEAARQPVVSFAFQIRPTNEDARPLGGLLVKVRNTVPTPAVELGTRMLDFNGIAYMRYEGPVASTLTLTFEVMTGEEVSLVTSGGLSFDPATERSIEVAVAVPAVPKTYVQVLAMATELGVTIPTALYSLMEGIDAESLDRVRAVGGLAGRSEAAVVDNLSVAQWIDHHAMLETIESDAALREFLIDHGYTNGGKIAAKTRAGFVSELAGGSYGEVTLAGVYLKAAKVDAVLSHLWVAKGAGHASNYRGESPLSAGLDQYFAKQCDCEECRSGVSPLAYLAALLDYGTKYILNDESPVDVDWFQSTLHQGFCELPADCSSVEKRVCQVRIAIEVLRQYLGGVDVPYWMRKPYLEQTYGLLLNQAGVTADEVRLASQNPNGLYDDLRNSLAQRLGIAVSLVDEFYLDSTGVNPRLTEDNLEKYFGFQSTLRNPYSDGLLEGSDKVTTWQFKGVSWNRNTDADGNLHLLLHASPSKIEVYRDSSLGADYLVGFATISSLAPHAAEIVEQNDSGLFGRIEIGNGYVYGITVDSSIKISVIPRLQAWRLAAQRLRWQEQDMPVGNTYFVADRTLPIIEPDWMGPDDLRVSTVSTVFGYYGPFDIWKHRRSWVDVIMGDLAGMGDDMGDIFYYMDALHWHRNYQEVDGGTTHSIGPWDRSGIVGFTDWGTLLQNLKVDLQSGNAITRQAAISIVEGDLRLTLAAFSRLAELHTKVLQLPATEHLTAEEIDDLHAILCQVAKNAYYAAWIGEEDNFDIVLSAAQFWTPIHAPKEGKWNAPIAWSPFYATAITMPFIDPVEVGLLDLPDPIFGAARIGLWQTRQGLVTTAIADIYAARLTGTPKSNPMLDEALGIPVSMMGAALESLLVALNDDDGGIVAAALVIVHEQLFLTEEEFRDAMKVISKEIAAAATVTDADYEALAKVLVNGWRRRQWAAWDTAEGSVQYWQCYKQKLPAWRSSKERRKLWVDGLAFYNRQPIVDPDLIKAGDIVNPEYNGNAVLDNAAYVLWREREAQINNSGGWLATIVGNVFETNVVDILGISSSVELEDLQTLYEQHKDVSGRLAQLNLDPRRLGVLAKLKREITNAVTPSDEEIADAQAILLQVQKQRVYGLWNIEERAAGIVVSPDYFRVAYSNYYEFIQYLGEILLPWRSSLAARRDWQDKLESRMAQEASVIEGIAGMVKATEDRVLIVLRDALLNTVSLPGHSLEEKGEYLTEKLFLDFRTQCCNDTTRVAQAIETLQVMYFSIRTGAILDDYPLVEMDNDNWDDDWKWLGTYGTWRSLMFVYMYPENVLLPSLKDRMSGKLRGLMGQVRNAARFTPDMACEVLHDYEEYLQDMADLSLQATVTTTVDVEADGCGMILGAQKEVDFHFALSGHSQSVYFCTVDQTAVSADIAQSSWELVPEADSILRIIGATVFQTKKGTRYVYFFALKTIHNDVPELIANRLNLSTMRWDNDLGDLKFDRSLELDMDTVLMAERARETDRIYFVGLTWARDSTWSPWYNNQLYYKLESLTGDAIKDRHVLRNWLNNDGDDWESDDWAPLGFFWMPKFRLAGVILTDEKFLCLLVMVQFHDAQPWYLGYHTIDVGSGLRQILIQRVIPPVSQIAINTALINNAQDQGLLIAFGQASAQLRVAPASLTGNYSKTAGIVKKAAGNQYQFIYYDYDSQFVTYKLDFEIVRVWYLTLLGLDANWTSNSSQAYPWGQCSRSVKVTTSNDIVAGQNLTFIGPCFDLSISAPGNGYVSRTTVHFRHANRPMLTRLELAPGQSSVIALNLLLSQQQRQPLLQHPSESINTLRASMLAGMYLANTQNTSTNVGYLQEAYYLLPMFVAIELQKNKHFEAALEVFRLVYDFTLPLAHRKIWYGLVAEETIGSNFDNVLAWLDNPENPHTIAGMRANTYTRFTIFSIVRCLLEMADQEFTTDSPESVPRARVLYQTAISLIQDEIYLLESEGCGALLDDLDEQVKDAGWYPEWLRLKAAIAAINNHDVIDAMVNGDAAFVGGIAAVFANTALSWEQKIMAAEAIYQFHLNALGSLPNRLCTVVSDWSIVGPQQVILGEDPSGSGVGRLGHAIGEGFLDDVALVTGKSRAELAADDHLAWLSEPSTYGAGEAVNLSLKQRLNGESGLYAGYYEANPLTSLQRIGNTKRPFIPYLNHYFCIPQNPVPFNLLLHAELNLFKIRHCRNIAGIHRELDPYGAPTDTTSGMPVIGGNGQISFPGTVSVPPTPYRYEVVLSRAKELVQLAAQAENAMLVTLEKLDSERYSLLRARQDMSTAKATVRLQDLRVKESEHEVDAAEMQQDKAQDALENYQGWIAEGLPDYEQKIYDAYGTLLGLHVLSAGLEMQGAIANLLAKSSQIAAETFGTTQLGAIASLMTSETIRATVQRGISITTSGLQIAIQQNQIMSSFEQRKREWTFQAAMSQWDVQLAGQQIKLANDRLRITGQERAIAQMQVDHAEETLEFLRTKFTNADLYDWMSGVLQRVYSYYLQHATSMAKIAQQQLAFERQESPANLILDDYWTPPSDNANVPGVSAAAGPDRRGLTGSSRLQMDLTKLDLYAFETEKRKLQLTKTMSLAQLFPAEFEVFRQTGLLTFRTRMDWFDRDFPGHYLRLIKRVRTSVIALVPPGEGVRARLATTGVSRVVVGGDAFQTIVTRRGSESVSLTSPIEATGLFEMLPDRGDMLYPFEAMGVDAQWEFRMFRAANPINFNTIADVLLTFEYTALESFDYEQQMRQSLDPRLHGERAFSFKYLFPDQWYDLKNASLTALPFVVDFELRKGDFPGLAGLAVESVTVMLVTEVPGAAEMHQLELWRQDVGAVAYSVGGIGVANANGVISSRSGSWPDFLDGRTPVGKWRLNCSGNGLVTNPGPAIVLAPGVHELIDDVVSPLVDILLIVGYRGDSAGYL